MSSDRKPFDPDEDIAWVVLHRLSWRATSTMPGSRVVIANCGHRAWIAPSSERFLADDPVGQGAYTICTDCMAQSAPQDDMQFGAAPGARAEFARKMGELTTDQFFAWLNSKGFQEW